MKSNKSQHILLVSQAGFHIGLGHLSRTLVAAKALHQNGYNVGLLLQTDQVPTQPTPDYLTVFSISFEQSLSNQVDKLIKRYQMVLFDLQPQHIPDDILNLLIKLKRQNIVTIAVDAMAQYSDSLSLVYTPSFQPNRQLSLQQQKNSVFGWDCFLLKVSQTKITRSSDSILILTGGADTTRLGQHWLIELDKHLPQHIHFNWVKGPFAAAPVLPAKSNRQIVIHQAPADLGVLMSSVSFAVTLYGISFYELLYYGVPTVVFSPYGDKDVSELSEIQRLQLAKVAKDEHDAIKQLNHLMTDPEQAQQLATAGRDAMANSNGDKLVKCVSFLLGQQ